MKKLYRVRIVAEVVVAAEDVEGADFIASGLLDVEGIDFVTEPPSECKVLPKGWDRGCIPFGSDDDKTIGDYMGSGKVGPT